MPTSSKKCSGRAVTVPTLLAGMLLGFASGCARPATTGEVALQAAPQEDSTRVSTGSSGPVLKRPHESVEDVLKGRFAGVEVTVNPDGSLVVRIRGASSFYASSDPLYVIDGTPVSPGFGGALAGVNPYDIESIEVLKYPHETALYGVRGGNGVILITTRRPKP